MSLLVLVTGGAGILGRQVCLNLAAQGHRVRALDIPVADFSGLEGANGIDVAKGDIRDAAFMRQAVEGVQCALHLAAILPPASERDRERTMAVNVDGTRNLLDALEAAGGRAQLVFTSSVVTYGDTSGETPPITVQQLQRPLDVYGESKKMAEALLRERGYPCTVLRIGGIAVPAFLEPPQPWPFTAEQRLEFVNRDDVALALVRCVGNAEALGRTFNVAGGSSWQTRGCDYVNGYYEAYGLPMEEATFVDRPGPYDWYDTQESQRVLGYQRTSYPEFIRLLNEAVARAVGE